MIRGGQGRSRRAVESSAWEIIFAVVLFVIAAVVTYLGGW